MVRFFTYRLCLAMVSLGGLRTEVRAGQELGPNLTAIRRSEILAEVATQTASADQLWAYAQKWHGEKSMTRTKAASSGGSVERGTSQASQTRIQDSYNSSAEQSIRICAACREFIHRFPSDPRGPEARILILDDHGYEHISSEESRELCEQIVASPSATAAARQRARKLLVLGQSFRRADEDKVENEFAAYEKDYPDDKLGGYLLCERLRYYSREKPQELEARLRDLVSSPNKATAAAAKAELRLRTEPLDFKFTATNGKTVDLAKMRGKVVMLYFWATWGEPKRDILSKVLELHRKYGDQKLQIIGFSMDSERGEMRRAVKAHKISWPNVNDTVESQGSAVAYRFNVSSPQEVWLLDRNGIAKQLPAGADLEAEIIDRMGPSVP